MPRYCVLNCRTICAEGEPCWLRGCDDIQSLLERDSQRQSAAVIAMVEKTNPEAADRLRLDLRNIDLGITQARSTWNALSAEACADGSRRSSSLPTGRQRVSAGAPSRGGFDRVGGETDLCADAAQPLRAQPDGLGRRRL